MPSPIGELLLKNSKTLSPVSDSPLLDCQILLAYHLDKPREWLYSHSEEILSNEVALAFSQLIQRRGKGEPVAYITGTKSFWASDFRVSPDTLIPRPETELLIEVILDRFDDTPRTVLDLGTGTGAIAISLGQARPNWKITGIDVSQRALAIAIENGVAHTNVTWVLGSWTSPISDAVDLIVTNPPYVAEDDPHLKSLEHEPRLALASGADGLDAIRQILATSYDDLLPGGAIMIEHGFDQQEQVIELMTQAGLSQAEPFRDIADQPRAVMAVRQL
jgi:release factor glutamine methyltransferase